jgi:hypothetical protein
LEGIFERNVYPSFVEANRRARLGSNRSALFVSDERSLFPFFLPAYLKN